MAQLRIVYLTAGAGGMYCGSCLHDNDVAKMLMRKGHEAILVPLYTPTLTDQDNASEEQLLFYGGINVYLQQLSPIFRWLPGPLERLLNSPKLVKWFAKRASATSAKKLGALTVSMLKGEDGNQRKEIRRLCAWLRHIEPDAIIFSNLLISGCLSTIESSLPGTQLAVMLQGDDIFYESLPEPYRSEALEEMQMLARTVDVFLVHSQDYRDRMCDLLKVAPERMTICPLSIDAKDLLGKEKAKPNHPATVGYLARIAPEKGLHLLVDAFIQLKQAGKIPEARLEIAGWLGKQNESYWRTQEFKLKKAKLQNHYKYWGTIDRSQKIDFLSSIDLLSVPTTYREPKGLFALEAMAAGVPYLLPAHGAFPELHERAQAGRLHNPEDVDDLALGLDQMLSNIDGTRQLAEKCRHYVRKFATPELEVAALLKAISLD